MYTEEEFLQISGIQHFVFCPRQWALIHIESQWAENQHTVCGDIFHERAHDGDARERRGDLLTVRGLRIFSATLGVSGVCDVVEFRRHDESGARLNGYEGNWLPMPIEYKSGTAKETDADRIQLCLQALCMEEMLGCQIEKGCLFYGKTRRRETVLLDEAIRTATTKAVAEMHAYMVRGYTPKPRKTKACRACSMADICLPELERTKSAAAYMENAKGDEL